MTPILPKSHNSLFLDIHIKFCFTLFCFHETTFHNFWFVPNINRPSVLIHQEQFALNIMSSNKSIKETTHSHHFNYTFYCRASRKKLFALLNEMAVAYGKIHLILNSKTTSVYVQVTSPTVRIKTLFQQHIRL